jgi:hypothetical protein
MLISPAFFDSQLSSSLAVTRALAKSATTDMTKYALHHPLIHIDDIHVLLGRLRQYIANQARPVLTYK